MAEFSHYCRSCDRNLVVGECLALTYILPGTDEVNGDVMVGG
jgi:hypothetical protein